MKRLIICGAGLGLLLAAVLLATGTDHRGRPAHATRAATPSAPTTTLDASFAYLAAQHTNRCDLQRAELLAYPDRQRLQGSCCQPMDRQSYLGQVGKLRRYRTLSVVPRDPYNVLVSLAKRLLGYQRTIKLTLAQQSTYQQAMRMSQSKGPCCCPCWRWDAFQGLSNYLIARKGYNAQQVAQVIDAVNGCGGTEVQSARHDPSTQQ